MEPKIYWFITVYQTYDPNGIPRHMRTWGFYTNKDDAYWALRTNMTDLWETVYNYAILEPYYEGISGYCFEEEREWFKYNKEIDGYEPIEEPEGVKHYVGFAIG